MKSDARMRSNVVNFPGSANGRLRFFSGCLRPSPSAMVLLEFRLNLR